jgi:hypothetical protein
MKFHRLLLCAAFASGLGCVFAGARDNGGSSGAAGTGVGSGAAGKIGPSGAAGGTGLTGVLSGSGGSIAAAGTSGAAGTGAGGAADGGVKSVCLDNGPDCVRACGLTSFPVGKVPPEILIIFDQSVSMLDPATGGSCGMPTPCGSKWTEMSTAIASVVTTTDTTIDWGLKMFPDMPACGVLPGMSVPIAPMNGAAIKAYLMSANAGPRGHTPTQLAVAAGVAYLKTLTTPNPKFILLATDGIPNCVPGAKSQLTYDMAGAVQAVADAAAAGFPTFVMGVGTGGGTADSMVFDPTLTGLATAGGKPRMGTPNWYHVGSSADVVAALATIQGNVNSCVFNLAQVPPDPTNIAIRAGGGTTKIPKDTTHANGWDYGPGMRSVQLYGSYCDQVVAGTLMDVQAIFGCPMQVIP